MTELSRIIKRAFRTTEYPGDSNLRNSSEGVEPFLLEDEFNGKDDWHALHSNFLDQAPDGYASALSFFTPEAFRFYLPAYLLADLSNELQMTEPVFYLTHGLTDDSKNVKVNPARFGGLTWFEYATDRFSVFTHQEAAAILQYLSFKKEEADTEYSRNLIEQAV